MFISFLAEYLSKLSIFGARSLVGTLKKPRVLEFARVAEEACSLSSLSNSQVPGAIGAIEFDQRSSAFPVEAWMVAAAELVEFPDNVVQIIAECPEANLEISFLFLQENERPEE